MKDTKRRFELFSFYDYTGIALHLSKMAEKGWLIDKISNFGWTYRRIDPKKLEFFVSYYPKASEFDPEPTEEQKAFHDFCEHTGWILAATAAQMQIFYNERSNPTPIETDPVLEIETIHAAAKKSYLPGYFIWLLISIMYATMFISGLLGNLIGLLSSTSNLFSGVAMLMLFLQCVTELYGYFVWRTKAKKAAARGEFIATPSHLYRQKILLGIVLTDFVYWLITVVLQGNPLMRTASLIMLLYMAVLIVLVNGIKSLLKRRKAPRSVNRIVTVFSSFVLAFVMTIVITFSILRAARNGLFERDRETYKYNGATFTVYMDELPLTVEDLSDISYDGYIKERRSEESLLLGQFVMRQHPRFDAVNYTEMPDLEYTITEIKLPFLYEFCKNSLLNERKDDKTVDGQVDFYDHYEPVDPTPWKAKEAYRLYWSYGHFIDRYLLCYEKRIVDIMFYWEPTPEQMAITADKLSGG